MANTDPAERQIVINGVPKDLLDDIDELATADDRSRASCVRKLLEEIVAAKKAAKAAAAQQELAAA